MPYSSFSTLLPCSIPTRRSSDLAWPGRRASASAARSAGTPSPSRPSRTPRRGGARGRGGARPTAARRRRGRRGPSSRGRRPFGARSEEHTSELQSPCNLVCRILLSPPSYPALSLHDALPISHGLADALLRLLLGAQVLRRRRVRHERLDEAAHAAEGAHAPQPRGGVGDDGVLHRGDGDLSALDRKSTRLNSSHLVISYAVFFFLHPLTLLYPYTTLFRSRMAWPTRFCVCCSERRYSVAVASVTNASTRRRTRPRGRTPHSRAAASGTTGSFIAGTATFRR